MRGALLAASLAACSNQPEHPRACAPPRFYWQQPHNIDGLPQPHVTVQIDHNSKIYFEGAPFRMDELTYQLSMMPKFGPPRVDVYLETEMGADCAVVEQVRNAFDKELNCKASGQCAEGIRSLWQRWPVKPGTPPT
jgi:hypothetical protein